MKMQNSFRTFSKKNSSSSLEHMSQRREEWENSIMKDLFSIDGPAGSWQIDWEMKRNRPGWCLFRYILDQRGRIRWIFPAQNRYPVHRSLSNYHFQLPRHMRSLTSIGFALGINAPFSSGSFGVLEKGIQPFLNLLRSVPHDSFAIYIGINGEENKSIIALNQGKVTTHFVKIAHSVAAIDLVYNEVYTLQILAQRLLRKLVYPYLYRSHGDQAVIISNVKPSQARRSMLLEPLHFQGLAELYDTFNHRRQLGDLPVYRKIKEELQKMREQMGMMASKLDLDMGRLELMWDILKEIFNSMPPQKLLTVSLGHGDFTPWNIFLSRSQLHVYDWEMAQESLPLLYDLFHFVYQASISQENSPELTANILDTALEHEVIERICQKYHVSPPFYHKLYLLSEIPRWLDECLSGSAKLELGSIETTFNIWEHAVANAI